MQRLTDSSRFNDAHYDSPSTIVRTSSPTVIFQLITISYGRGSIESYVTEGSTSRTPQAPRANPGLPIVTPSDSADDCRAGMAVTKITWAPTVPAPFCCEQSDGLTHPLTAATYRRAAAECITRASLRSYWANTRDRSWLTVIPVRLMAKACWPQGNGPWNGRTPRPEFADWRRPGERGPVRTTVIWSKPPGGNAAGHRWRRERPGASDEFIQPGVPPPTRPPPSAGPIPLGLMTSRLKAAGVLLSANRFGACIPPRPKPQATTRTDTDD